MSTEEQALTSEKWQAIITNDPSYNDQFFYAVKTTGIFCRPSCKSKAPKQENVRIFTTSQQALEADFRPCKRCRPTGERLPDKEWVAIMTQYIDNNYTEPLTLELLADMCHGSPYHLHRTFKKVMQMTPVDYIQQKRIAKACEYLRFTERAVADIAGNVGLPNTSYFITLFKKKTGMTPTQFRQQCNNEMSNETKIMEVIHHGE